MMVGVQDCARGVINNLVLYLKATLCSVFHSERMNTRAILFFWVKLMFITAVLKSPFLPET